MVGPLEQLTAILYYKTTSYTGQTNSFKYLSYTFLCHGDSRKLSFSSQVYLKEDMVIFKECPFVLSCTTLDLKRLASLTNLKAGTKTSPRFNQQVIDSKST